MLSGFNKDATSDGRSPGLLEVKSVESTDDKGATRVKSAKDYNFVLCSLYA